MSDRLLPVPSPAQQAMADKLAELIVTQLKRNIDGACPPHIVERASIEMFLFAKGKIGTLLAEHSPPDGSHIEAFCIEVQQRTLKACIQTFEEGISRLDSEQSQPAPPTQAASVAKPEPRKSCFYPWCGVDGKRCIQCRQGRRE